MVLVLPVSTVVKLFPGLNDSDSWNLICPGMSISNRCILRCLATRCPDLLNTGQALYSLSPSLSGSEPSSITCILHKRIIYYTKPPIRKMLQSFATADKASVVVPGMVSAYSEKYDVP